MPDEVNCKLLRPALTRHRVEHGACLEIALEVRAPEVLLRKHCGIRFVRKLDRLWIRLFARCQAGSHGWDYRTSIAAAFRVFEQAEILKRFPLRSSNAEILSRPKQYLTLMSDVNQESMQESPVMAEYLHTQRASRALLWLK
jgi:hypothetical protein